jgi:hypothetical protein
MTATTDATTADVGAYRCDPDALRAEAIEAIEVTLVWSRHTFESLIGLGQLITFLEAGGPVEVAAPRMLRQVKRTEVLLAGWPVLLDRLRDIAERGRHHPDEPHTRRVLDLPAQSPPARATGGQP